MKYGMRHALGLLNPERLRRKKIPTHPPVDVEKLKQDLAQATKENDYLRGLLAVSGAPCVYCGLEDKGKCTRGFPGCAWADDVFVAFEQRGGIHGDPT